MLPVTLKAHERLTKILVDKLDSVAKDYLAWCGKLARFGARV